MTKRRIVIHHSPDADDAFMFYGLVSGAVSDAEYEIEHALSDIESLNQRTRRGELEVTALSVHAYAFVADHYAILRTGASMGGVDYGPRLVAREAFDLGDGELRSIAIPGELTSAALALRIYLKERDLSAELVNMNFDKVQDAVLSGAVDAGVIIHEGQLTHTRDGLVSNLDLGQWWWEQTRLPLPLGVNVVQRSLGQPAMQAVSRILRASVEYGLAHRREALEYALSYGRGLSVEDADKFVSMYVNERTRDLGSEGMESIQKFLRRGADLKLLPAMPQIDFV
ncbi:MAG: ABC transporter substrate-binding protein [Oligoflexia bacterium]|nr:ABC transporter substrate-binding protein [Oligoflexia bacterium]